MTTYEQEIEIANKIKNKYDCDIIIQDSLPYTLYCAIDIGKILGLSSIRGTIRFFVNVYLSKKTKGGKQKVTYITYDTLIKLLTNCRKPESIEFAKTINIDVLTKHFISTETDIVKCILTTFNGHTMKTQYKVDNYFIDLFFVEYNLAIECDEKYHSTDNNQTNDILRQNYITQKLGCVFIRCNPQNKGFNLFELLNQIYKHLSNNPSCLAELQPYEIA